MTRKLGTGKVTAISVAMTAVALLGFYINHSFVALCLWATLLMPPVFGLIANHITVALLSVYLLVILVVMFAMHEALTKKTKE